jgi:hypothetical protein
MIVSIDSSESELKGSALIVYRYTYFHPLCRPRCFYIMFFSSSFQDGLNTSGDSENDIPKFINDNNDKTSYLRGKFLGKVRNYIMKQKLMQNLTLLNERVYSYVRVHSNVQYVPVGKLAFHCNK